MYILRTSRGDYSSESPQCKHSPQGLRRIPTLISAGTHGPDKTAPFDPPDWSGRYVCAPSASMAVSFAAYLAVFTYLVLPWERAFGWGEPASVFGWVSDMRLIVWILSWVGHALV